MLLDSNGIQLNVELVGEGPPLMLLHGFTGSSQSWRPLLPLLQRQNQLLLVDLIGHGLSEAPADSVRYSVDSAAQDLLQVLDYFGFRKVSLLGYSMGGRCALRLAVQAPERFSALILESSSPGIADAAARQARRQADEALAVWLEAHGLDAFVERWTSLPLFASQQQLPDAVKEELRRQRLRNCLHGLANSLRGMGTGAQDSLWDKLAEVKVPVLLLAGELDDKFRQIGCSMQSLLPFASLQVLPNAGHTVHLEQPELFVDRIEKFLASL